MLRCRTTCFLTNWDGLSLLLTVLCHQRLLLVNRGCLLLNRALRISRTCLGCCGFTLLACLPTPLR
uniref:Uncharacterized protein n=1 Tax=Setaria italica TaxID=4555 RepID=K3ZYU4_SETIT